MIDAVEKVTEITQRAMDSYIPSIKIHTLPYPGVDDDIKLLMDERRRIKIILMNMIDNVRSKKKLLELRI